MPIKIDPLPENERHRQEIERQVDAFIAKGGQVSSCGVTTSAPSLTMGQINDRYGRIRNRER